MIHTVIQTGTGESTGGGELTWITIGLHRAMDLGNLGGGGSGTGPTGDTGTGGQPTSPTKNNRYKFRSWSSWFQRNQYRD